MNKFLQQLKYQFNAGGMYIKLLIINTAIFFLFGVFVIVFKLMLWNPAALIDFKDFFSLYSKPIEFITHPWGIFTYMFMHHDFWHLFGNMLILFFIGRLFEENLGSKRMLSTYIIGGVFGYFIGKTLWWSVPEIEYSALANLFFENVPGLTIDSFNKIKSLYEEWNF